jgi:hypothetical protein
MFKSVSAAFSQWFGAFRRLPQTWGNFLKERQRQTDLLHLEAERLDRIRNPDKYRGK